MDDIDIERLRQDLISYFEGAFFVGGFGAASMDALEVRKVDSEELIKIAKNNGFNLEKYIITKRI